MTPPLDHLRAGFAAHFGGEPEALYRAPGRVNLIGEHTDYNDGFVMPVAIDRALVLAARRRPDARVRLYSLDFEAADAFDLGAISSVAPGANAPTWSNYLRGVLAILQAEGHVLGGFDAVLAGDVPRGSGLSSSAALEVVTATLANDMFGLGLGGRAIARLAQRAENEFVGVQCGIMDQFASALGEKGRALWLDCRSLEVRSVPLELEAHEMALAIVDSGVRRGLVDSQFNARRAECGRAVAELEGILERPGLASLRDVTPQDLLAATARLTPVALQRARHVISENARVLAALEALEAQDLPTFGRLMNESHASLKDDYQVSTPELDTLVGLLQRHPGVAGARLTGAGFGGCTVALVRRQALASLPDQVLDRYRALTGREPQLYACEASQGASRL